MNVPTITAIAISQGLIATSCHVHIAETGFDSLGRH